jgi:hypothetical protein
VAAKARVARDLEAMAERHAFRGRRLGEGRQGLPAWRS